jgi:Domain of unknown function (DUF6259)
MEFADRIPMRRTTTVATTRHTTASRSHGRLLRLLFVAAISALALAPSARGQQATATADGFVLSTKAIEIAISNGAVTRVVNKLTGEYHTTPAAQTRWMPRGAVCSSPMRGGMAGVRTLHSEWGSHPIYGQQLAESIARVTRAPGADSRVECLPIERGMRCVYRGLTDGVTKYPNDSLVVEAIMGASAAEIEITATAMSTGDDVIGVIVPIENLLPRHAVYVPSFGGLCYTPEDLAGKHLFTLDRAPFVEAPIIVAEGSSGSLAVWVEDSKFPPYATFFGGDGSASAIGIEAMNYMPFDGTRGSRAAKWHVAVTRGRWPTAMVPYRDWYTATFAREIAQRNQQSWAKGISVIVDRVSPVAGTLATLARTVDPARTLLHDWNPRKESFDTMLPDWTPAPSFVRMVQEAHRSGFKAMGYVNTYCVNAASPVFVRDGLDRFALTRKFASVYRSGTQPKTLANSAPGEILYLDPLSPDWRKYHIDMMVQWRNTTGADANYEDTGGTGGDFGNGQLAGLTGAEASTAQFRELLERNPVPMASEFAPDNMAFAANWALRYSQVWGDESIRQRWESRHRPMVSWLHGDSGRAWVPTVAAETEEQKWTVVACSDALGGVAQLEATPALLEARTGLARHMLERARIFSELGLEPTCANWPNDPSVACQYRDRNGNIYTYRVRGGVQELIKPSGEPIYQRIKGLHEHQTKLRIPGWPAYGARGPIALDPSAGYALSHASRAATTVIQIDRCPKGVAIARYVETPDFVLVSFAPNGRSGSASGEALSFLSRSEFSSAILRDRTGKVVRRDKAIAANTRVEFGGDEPESLLLLARAVAPMPEPTRSAPSIALSSSPPVGRFISDATGIERGGSFVPQYAMNLALSGIPLRVPVRFTSGGGDSEIAFDYLVQPPASDSAFEFTVRNTQLKHGDGSVCRAYINGKQVFTQDLGPRVGPLGERIWDTAAHVCRIPVGAHAGQPVVLTVAIWGKGNENADEIWLGEPRLVDDSGQTSQATTVAVVP